jgi:hypothetical protein
LARLEVEAGAQGNASRYVDNDSCGVAGRKMLGRSDLAATFAGLQAHAPMHPTEKSGDIACQVNTLHANIEAVSRGVVVRDRVEHYADLVGSAGLRSSAVHRWYYYKEGFSPLLPGRLVDSLGTAGTGVVMDPFLGVGTTPIALRSRSDVTTLLGSEYSPFAHFVATAKIAAAELEPKRLRRAARRLIKFKADGRTLSIPSLSSLHDERIFDRRVVYDLLGARRAIEEDNALTNAERAFFLLGLAAIVEDVSGAMKDGRALRIRNGRKRRPNALVPVRGAQASVDVRSTLNNQWLSMIEDCEALRGLPKPSTTVRVAQGDAREVGDLMTPDGGRLAGSDSVGLALFSPPYLNCVDYSEVYKLELWLLGLVSTSTEFRRLREGTLRSHPSVAFPERPVPWTEVNPVFSLIEEISAFLEDNLSRRPVGTMVRQYFADMYEVFSQLRSVVVPGGAVACVVANSTFSKRNMSAARRAEEWRMPIPTDVFLAQLAESAGFDRVEIWAARHLRPRNVTSGSARESIVVARRAG